MSRILEEEVAKLRGRLSRLEKFVGELEKQIQRPEHGEKLRLYGVYAGGGVHYDIALIPFTQSTLEQALTLASAIVSECSNQYDDWFLAGVDGERRDSEKPPYVEFWEESDLYVETPSGDLYMSTDEERTPQHGWIPVRSLKNEENDK